MIFVTLYAIALPILVGWLLNISKEIYWGMKSDARNERRMTYSDF
jgi:hypothetical protein